MFIPNSINFVGLRHKYVAYIVLICVAFVMSTAASFSKSIGWPAHYGGVMLQGFYWGSFKESSWKNLEDSVAEFSKYFDLIWVPQSGGMAYEGSQTMGYMPYYFFSHNSCFGTEEQLKSMIKAYKAKGTGIIEDVVINHHSSINQTDMLSFPTETYNGETYALQDSDVLKDDDGGKTQTYLDYINSLSDTKLSLSKYGEEECKSPDRATCESFDGARDLDHRSKNVNRIIKAYEKFLLDDNDGLGYAGFRYDMARGFMPEHLVDYNKAAEPRFSVGEVFDGNFNEVKWWLNKWTDTVDGKIVHYNAAFDFPLHYSVMTKGFKNGDFSQVTGAFTLDATGSRKNTPIFSDRSLSRYDITFVDNHDTYYPRYDRSLNNADNMVTANVLAANAYILGMPGTPCIYYKHWLDPTLRPGIAKLIMARKAAGIDNMSRIIRNGYDTEDGVGYYAVVQGTVGKVLMVFGEINADTLTAKINDANRWTKAVEGENFAFYLSTGTAYDNYTSYINGTATPARWTDTTNDDVTKDGDDEAQSATETIKVNGKKVFVYTTSPKLYAYVCEGSGWKQLTGDFPGVNMMQDDEKNNISTQTVVGQDGSSRQYHVVEVYASDYLNIVLSTGEMNDQRQGLNQTNDITKLTDSNIYLTFTPGDASAGQTGHIASYTNITEDVTGNIRTDTIYTGYDAGKHSIYFKNTMGWYNPRIYVTGDDGKGNWTGELAGAWDKRETLRTVTMNGEQYYVWNYTGDDTTEPKHVIISNNGNTPQSVNIDFKDNSVYELSLTKKDGSGNYELERTTDKALWGKTSDNSSVAEDTKNAATTDEGKAEAKAFAAPLNNVTADDKPSYTHTIYFINSVQFTVNGEDGVKIHGWGNDFPSSNWDTNATMQRRPEKVGSYYVYSYSWTNSNPDMPEGIIFHDGGNTYNTDHGRQSSNIGKGQTNDVAIQDGYVYELTTDGAVDDNNHNQNLKLKTDAVKKYNKPYTVYFKNNGMTDPGIWWWGNNTDAGTDLKPAGSTESVKYDNRPSMTKMTIKCYELYGYSFPSTMKNAPANIKIEDKQGKGSTIEGAEFHDEYVYTDAKTFVPLSEYKETSNKKTYTVYFRNKQNWDKVKIYTENPKISGEWPGTEITEIDRNHDGIPLYKWSYTTDDPAFTLPTKLIFNNGNGGEPSTQSPDLTFVDNKVYVLTAKTDKTQWCDYKLDEEKSTSYNDYKENIKFTIYFNNSVGWNEPHIWAWNDHGNFTGGNWDTKPALTKTTLNNKVVWSWTYDPDAEGVTKVNGLPKQIIFTSADAPQSESLDFVDGAVYQLSLTDKTDGDKPGSKHKLLDGYGKESKEMEFLNALYARYIRNGSIATLCLPFNLTTAELVAMNIKAYDLVKADGTEYGKSVTDTSLKDGMLTFKRVSKVEAFHPYVIIFNGGTSAKIFNSRIISHKKWSWGDKTAKDMQRTVGDWTFQGNLVPNVVKSDDNTTYFGYTESTHTFVQMRKGKATVPVSVCFFMLPTSKVNAIAGKDQQTDHGTPLENSAKHYVVTLDDDPATADLYVYGDGTTLGVRSEELGVTSSSAPIYNLAGQRVGKDYKGIVIQNGRKVLRK